MSVEAHCIAPADAAASARATQSIFAQVHGIRLGTVDDIRSVHLCVRGAPKRLRLWSTAASRLRVMLARRRLLRLALKEYTRGETFSGVAHVGGKRIELFAHNAHAVRGALVNPLKANE